MHAKKYRWNPRKCARNLGGLALRTMAAAMIAILVGAGPAIAETPQTEKTAEIRPETTQRAQTPTDEEKTPEIESQPPQEAEEPAYTQEELELLAHVVAGEAKGCDDQEQRYVASVVLNRIAHHLYPDTMAEVISQPSQYGCWNGGAWNPAAKTPTDRCYENARYILENGPILPENVVFQAQFKQGDGVYTQTAWHIYSYTNR